MVESMTDMRRASGILK